ncbi:MAG TPA: type II toxin-antitoxin system Phd/YefM family antitoxin [Sulfurovum sp.]|nr:type II toxin-antitoxin system Phd/YefM family antitoxin [Sulfurovum sp.]
MLELGISQAQTQFTKLLTQQITIVDKKSKKKKAVILPYEEYSRLLARAVSKESLKDGAFSKFAGVLDADFETSDTRYNEIVK